MDKLKAFARAVPDRFADYACLHPKTVLVVFGVLLVIALVT